MSALAAERLDFKVAVLAVDGGCTVHDDPADCQGEDVVAHHVVYQKHLRDLGRHDLLWDPNGGMAVCGRAHRRHHSGREPIPRARIPKRCLDFVARHGLGIYLDRYYPEV